MATKTAKTGGKQPAKTHWSFERPATDAQPIGHVLLTFRMVRDEDGFYVGKCQELGISSFGDSVDGALGATLEATSLYLETLDDQGERERVLDEKGIKFLPGPPHDNATVPIEVHPGEVVSPQRLSMLVGAH